MTDKIQEHIASIKWQDISVILTNNNDSILILLCSDQLQSDKLYNLITKNPFILKVLENEDKTHEIRIELTNSVYGIGLHTPKSLQSYPPLKFLHNKQVTSITCGYVVEKSINYNPNLHALISSNIHLN